MARRAMPRVAGGLCFPSGKSLDKSGGFVAPFCGEKAIHLSY